MKRVQIRGGEEEAGEGRPRYDVSKVKTTCTLAKN